MVFLIFVNCPLSDAKPSDKLLIHYKVLFIFNLLPCSGDDDPHTKLSPKKEVEESDSLIHAVVVWEEDGSVDIKEECVEEKDPLSTTSQITTGKRGTTT